MKINSCFIASFGKFKNYKINFTDGFNLIYGDNEAGKSTIMSFIKMMFYGNGGRVADIDKNLRKKYMPWDSSLMAGSIEFTAGGKSYRLEREFRGSNATDKITLTDLALGTEVKLGSKGDIGSEIFGLSEAAFEKTVFIGALGAPEKNSAAEGELNGRLSNLASTGDEDVSLELVSARIKKAREHYKSKSGRIGVYDKAAAALFALEDELRVARTTEVAAAELEDAIKAKETEIANCTAEAGRYFAIMKKAELASKRTNLIKYIEASTKLSEATKSITLPDGSVADKEYADRIREVKNLLDTKTSTLQDREKEAEKLRLDIAALEADGTADTGALTERKAELSTKIEALGKESDGVRETLFALQAKAAEKPKKKANLPLILIGALLLIAAAISFLLLPPYKLIAAAAGVIGLVLFILGFCITKKSAADSTADLIAETQQSLDGLLDKIAKAEAELDSVNSLINSLIIESSSKKALLDAKHKELIERSEGILALKEEILGVKASLTALCEPFGAAASPLDVSALIEKAESDIKAAEVMLSMAADSTNCKSREEAEKRLLDLDSDETLRGLSLEAITSAKDEYRRISEAGGHLREELASLKSRLKNLISSGKTVPVLEYEIAALKETLAADGAFCDAADIALEVLTESFAEMREGFGGKLEGETSAIFRGLTGGAYSSLDISKDFELKANREGVFGAKEWQFLSAGTADQAYLALRIAVSSLIGDESDTLPLIMDDSLTQYDSKRAEAALAFLTEYAKEHQILLFTCHNNIKNSAAEHGAETIDM